MIDENSLSHSVFTPPLMFEYINLYTNKKNITYSEFRGFTKFNNDEYIIVMNFTSIYDKKTKSFNRGVDFIKLERFRLFLLKKRFEQ